ncbi:MAG: LLM class flavin-dependent oxidoreductase [Acidimicrobiales bacterium]
MTQNPSATELKFGMNASIADEFADAATLATLAHDAEIAGWDGFFIMDHLIRRKPWKPMIDPWIALTAIAIATTDIVVGPMVTPLPRRRPSVLARQTVTLDQLCKGRLRLGVGLGAPDDEFTRFGESADPKRRARVLDESLELLQLLWSGEPVTYHGEHVHAEDVHFLPRPHNGQIPIWVAGGWPSKAPFRRAARYDGVWPISGDRSDLSIEDLADCVAAINQYRELAGTSDKPFEICYTMGTPITPNAESIDKIGRAKEAGMTWCIESLDTTELTFDQIRERIIAGPPHQ